MSSANDPDTSEGFAQTDEREELARWLHMRFGKNQSSDWDQLPAHLHQAWRDLAWDAPGSAPQVHPPATVDPTIADALWEDHSTGFTWRDDEQRYGEYRAFLSGLDIASKSDLWHTEHAVRWVGTEGQPVTDEGSDVADICELVESQDGWAEAVYRLVTSWASVPKEGR